MEKFLHDKLKKARERSGLSQGAFARALKLSSEYISLLEAGKRTPSFRTLQKIAAFLNRDIAFFFHERDSVPPDAFTLLFRAESVDDRARVELQKFRRYCDDYLRLEVITNRHLELAPLYAQDISAERMADEERRRLGLGSEPIRDVFALVEANGCRILRLPLSEDSKISGAFVFLEQKDAAFALVNSLQPAGRQTFSAAHEYCHYLKDRAEGPVVESPDVFIGEYASLYHPREPFAQAFAARFLMPPAKVQEIIEKDLRVHAPQRLTYDQVLYLKRYFGVSTLAMLRTLRNMGYIGRTQLDDYAKADPEKREKDVFGSATGGNGEKGKAAGGGVAASLVKGIPGLEALGSPAALFSKIRHHAIPSDRYKLLQQEAAKKRKRQ